MKDQLDQLITYYVAHGISYQEFVHAIRKGFVECVLARNGGNQCRTAEELGMHRNTLSRTCAQLGIKPRQHKPPHRVGRLRKVESA